MSDTTTRLGLRLPRETDFYDINIQNANMQRIDGEVVRLYTGEADPADPGPLIWLQPVGVSGLALLALGDSAGTALNLSVDDRTLAVTNAQAGESGGAELSYIIR